MADLQPGDVLADRFEVVGVLGHGGMATVYLVQDRLREEAIALKVLHGHLARSASMRSRLRREVSTASRLRHPNALVAWDLHDIGGSVAVSMPLHRGRTLSGYVERHGPMTASALRRVATQLASALREAHASGIVHRDVTPSNVLVDDEGDAVLSDFGLARFTDQRTATATGALGTAGYAAPEVYQGMRSDPRSDLYSLGAVLYQAATGVSPFHAADPVATLRRQLDDDRTPLAEARPDLPEHLVQTIEGLLAVDPDARPQGAAEVVEALERREAPAVQTTPVAAPPSPPAKAALVRRSHLPPGEWTVVVHERGRDRQRRRHLRRRWRPQAIPGVDVDVGRVVQGVQRWVMNELLGLPERLSPEEALAQAVALEADLPRDALTVPPAVLEPRFRLVESVAQGSANRLARAADQAGFSARPQLIGDLEPSGGNPVALGLTVFRFAAAMGLLCAALMVIWVFFVFQAPLPIDSGGLAFGFGPAGIFLVVMVLALLNGLRLRARHRRGRPLPIAYGDDLRFHLSPETDVILPAPAREVPAKEAPARERSPSPAPKRATSPKPAPQQDRHASLLQRTRQQLEALARSIEEARDYLPEVALRDLRTTLKELTAKVETLGRSAAALERELAGLDEAAAASAVDRVEARLERLHTLAKTGAVEGMDEIPRLEAALESHRQVLLQVEALEGRLTLVLARLLETGAAAARARVELLEEPEPARSAENLLARLNQQTADAQRALAEVEGREGRVGDPREGRLPKEPVDQSAADPKRVRLPERS
jgi:hypothetical protein